VNEFYRLAGRKFSTSRNHAVWAHEFLADEDPGLVRLYLCWDRPDRYESDFLAAGYAEFRDRFSGLVGRLDPTGSGPHRTLAELDTVRAEQALTLTGFDPALAARAALAVLATPSISDADRDRAHRLVSVLSGSAGGAEQRGRAAA
jgi:methionyl-tRNA synthetase